jgi:hypothetical protein
MHSSTPTPYDAKSSGARCAGTQPAHSRAYPRTVFSNEVIAIEDLSNTFQINMTLRQPHCPRGLQASLPIDAESVEYTLCANVGQVEDKMSLYGVDDVPTQLSSWGVLGSKCAHEVDSRYSAVEFESQQNYHTSININPQQNHIEDHIDWNYAMTPAEKSDSGISMAVVLPSPIIPLHDSLESLDLSSVESMSKTERLCDYLNNLPCVGSHTLDDANPLHTFDDNVEAIHNFTGLELGADDFSIRYDLDMDDKGHASEVA